MGDSVQTVLCPKCYSSKVFRADRLVRSSNPPQFSYRCEDCGEYFFSQIDLGNCPDNVSDLGELKESSGPESKSQSISVPRGALGNDFAQSLGTVGTVTTPVTATGHATQYGWVCPKCGAVMAPFMPTCCNCKGNVGYSQVTCVATGSVSNKKA